MAGTVTGTGIWPFRTRSSRGMNGTRLGSAQLLFVRVHDELRLDLVLSGAAYVEGQPLVAGSPVSLSLEAPAEERSRRRMIRQLFAWADHAVLCHVDLSLDEGVAAVSRSSSGETLRGTLTDLDVLFADDVTH